MTSDAVLGLVERVGLPIAVLAAGVVVLWRLGGAVLRALVESYRERIASLAEERDHFRDRAEAHDDRTNGLCRELIDECRRGPAHGGAGD